MTRIANAVMWVLAKAASVMLVLMVVMVFANVVLRYFFNAGLAASDELARIFFVWMIFLGATVSMRNHEHLGLESIVEMLPAGGQRICVIVGEALMLLVCGVLAWGSYKQLLVNWHTTSPVTGISQAVMYFPALLAAVCIALMLVASLFRLISGRFDAADLRLSADEADGVLHTHSHERTQP